MTKRTWHPRFLRYMKTIAEHPNYKGLEIKQRSDGSYGWIVFGKSADGQKRIEWCKKKADELNIKQKPGFYAEVMREIHPTKWKVCQTCGKEMSLYYHYPNANFVKALNKKFGCEFTDCDHISDIWDELINDGVKQVDLAEFLIHKGGLDLVAEVAEKDDIIDGLEKACRTGNKALLGPGAMSNFPDRFDGFHTYNRCCRATQDTGRSKQNLKSYTKDRRAYEYWSDGNIHAANQFMGSTFFDGVSADHIGPISLGFIHDPRYLQPMLSGDNSSKRDRLQLEDIEKIIETEARTGVYPMSWYSKLIWEHIRENYADNRHKIESTYRNALKQNMANFMYVLYTILENCPDKGEDFLVKAFIEPNYEVFNYTYIFNASGEIVNRSPRNFTDRSRNEMQRYRRIAIESVYDYNLKDNRNISDNLTSEEESLLNCICKKINKAVGQEDVKTNVVSLMEQIQNRLIAEL